MNPTDPNNPNISSLPTSPAPSGQGAVNDVPTPVQPGAVYHPPTATDQISAAQSSAPGVDNFSAPVASNPINTQPVSSGVDSPTGMQPTPGTPQAETSSYSQSAAPDAAGAPLGNNSPLHPEVLAKDLWGGGTPPPEAPEEHVKTPWFKSLWFILLAALFATGLIAGAFFIFGKPSGDTTINNSQVNENYEVTTVPLSDLASDQIITIDNDSQLAINGQLRINNSAVIEATEQPDNPEAGMLWFSSANNTLYYYNGTQFVPMSTSIGGVAGTLSLGGGLSLVNSSIVNSGVISIQGQAGNVDFAAGGGISINGTTITNTGVLGITAGNPNQLSVTSNNGNVSISLAGISAGGVLIGTAGGGIGTALPANPGLCLISNAFNQPEFGSCTGTTTVTSLNGLNNAVTIAAGAGISVTPSGNTLTIANTGGGVSSINTGVGAINIQNASLSGQDIIIDTATTSALGLVSADGTTVLINGSGELSIGQNVATSANVSFNSLSLTTDLSVSNGGTGASSFTAGGLLVGNGSSPIGVVSALSAGQCLLSGAGPSFTPSFSNCPVGGNISQGSQSGEAQNANRIVKYGVNANTITNSLLTDDGSTVTVTSGDFTVSAGTITGNGSGITNVNAATLQGNPASAFELAISTLPVTKGGTGLNTLTQYGVLVGNGTNNVNPITASGSGLCFMSNVGMPSFQSCPVGGNLSGSGTDGTLSKFDINGDLVDSLISEASGTILAGGKLIVRDNSTDAFVVQQSQLGNQTLVVDTTNNNVGIGFAPTLAEIRLQVNGAAQFLVDTLSKPTASVANSGAIYYDTDDQKFKIIENGVEKDLCNTVNQSCGAGTADITLQSAYSGGNTITTADARNIAFTLADTATDSNFLVNITGSSTGKFAVQGAGNDLFSVNSTGAILGQGGPGGVAGSLSFKNSQNAYNVELKASTLTSETYTLTLPTTNGNNLECLKTDGSGVLSWGTCVVGGSGGGITGSGTADTIPLFTPDGQTLGNSIITQPDTNNININGDLTLGTANSKAGSLVLSSASSAYTVTLQSGLNSGNFALVLPTDDGSPDECLKTDGNGNLSWTTCLTGGGAGGGVTSLNTFSGSVSIAGTTNQVTVSNNSNIITLSLPQSIATTSAPTFGGLTLSGTGQLSLGTNASQAGKITFYDGQNSGFSAVLQAGGAFGGNRTINVPDASGTLAVSASGNIALSPAGNITFTGQLPIANGGTGAANAPAARSNLGAAASGSNSDITALSAVATLQNSSGSLTVGNTSHTLTLQGGAATKLSATNGSFTSELVFANPTGNATITIPNATGTICLQNSGACGFLTSAVQSLQGQTGALTLTGGTGITINPGSLTITNAGVTSIAGTANQISASAATGGVTLSLPNDVYLGVSTSAAGTLSLWDSDATHRAILQAANLDSNRTYTLPNATGTLAVSAIGNIALNSTTGEISFTGTLPISSGGTGTTSTPSSGSLLIGNSSNGYTVATLTQGSGVTITNGNGSITIAAPNAGSCSTCANQSLTNLSGTGIATDRVAKLNAAGTVLVSSDIYDTGTAITVGDGADNNQTVKLQGGNTAAAVSIQSLAGGTVSVGTDNVANNIQIGIDASSASQTIKVGSNTSGTATLTVGSLTASSTTTIQGGTGVSAISIQQGTGGTVAIGTTNAGVLSIGNVGSTYSTTIRSGSGGVKINPANAVTAFQVLQNSSGNALLNGDTTNMRVGIGTAAPTSTLHVLGPSLASNPSGNGTAAAPLVTVAGGAGGDSTSTDTFSGVTAGAGGGISISSGAGGNNTQYACPFICAGGSGGAGGAFSIQAGAGGNGSLLNSSYSTGGVGGSLSLQAGNGGQGWTGGSGGSITLQAGSAYAGGGSTGTAGSINIQTAANGTINIATANANNTVQIGNIANATTQTINIGNNGTASSQTTVNIGSLIGASPVTIQGGTSGITANSSTISGTAFTVNSSTATTGTGLAVTPSALTTGTALSVTANALTSGTGLSVSTTSASYLSGNQVQVVQSPTYTTDTTNATNLLNLNRTITLNNPSQDIALNNTATGSASPSSTFFTLSGNITVNSGNNRYVVVTVHSRGAQTCSVFGSPTFDGVSNFTTIDSYGGTGGNGDVNTTVLGMPAPNVGSNRAISITLFCGGSVSSYYWSAMVFNNVSQTGSYSSVTRKQSFSSPTSMDIASTNTTQMAVDALTISGSYSGATTQSGQVRVLNSGAHGYSSYRPGQTTTTTMGWNGPNGTSYSIGFALNRASALNTLTGSVASFSSNCSGTGNCADTSNILNLNQQFSGGTGAVLAIQNAGSGPDIQLSKGTIQTTATSATSTNSVGVSIKSGNASGATSNSGDVTIDSGTATGSTGNIYIGNANALTVQIGNTNATIGTWANNSGYNLVISSVSQPRMAHGSAIYNGYVYVVGGQSSNSVANAVTGVYFARLNADGSLPTTGVGVWSDAGNNLPAKRTFHSVVASNGYLYAIGGMDETSAVKNTVYYAKINSNGTIGAWQTESDTITAVQGHRSFAYNGYLYVVGGSTTSATTGAVSTVQYARLNADGSTGSWGTTTGIGGSSLVSRYSPGVAVGNGYVYVAGGIDSSGTVHSTVYLAKLKSDGTIDAGAYNASTNPGAWRTTNAISSGGTQPRYGLQLVASNGNLYVFGGTSGGSQTGVFSAQLQNDGSISSWSTLRSMTLAANYHQVVAANGYFYTIGGIDGSNAVLNTVYYSSTPRVKVAGSLDLIGSDNIGLNEGGAGGELTAGNTRIVGTFDVSDQANFMQDVKIGGNLLVGGNPTNTNPVFAVQNATGVNAIQVSANNLSLTGINANDTVLRVAMDSVTNRSISAAGYISGLAFNTANGDYAEWIPWSGPKPPAGSVIDYNGAKMVVSSLETAAVIANDKFSDGNSILVAFTGQVSVRVTGQVNAGDILVDNGDGTARAISSSNASLSDYVSRIGTALESGTLNGKVLTLIAGPGADSSRFSQQANTFADLNVSGSLTTNDLVVMGNALFQGNITVNGRIITGGGTPLATALSAAGTGATVTIDGNDSAGRITITTGSGTTAGEISKIDFSTTFGKDAKTNLTPMNGSAAQLEYYYSSTNTNFTLKSNNQLSPNTTYIYSYWVVE